MQENNINYPKFKVCVRCFTFNQAKYITDALNGFTMQQTDFPFVCCIVDDASTDGEQQVIMEYVQEHFDMFDASVSYRKETDYADITYAQHKANKNCYFAVLLLKENHYSQRKDKMPYLSEWRDNTEYEALCEGDDYWTASLKLQKQVDILESNPEVGLVHTDFDLVEGKRRHFKRSSKPEKYLSFLLKGNFRIGTLTVVYRRSLYDELPKDWEKMTPRLSMGDLPLWIELAAISQFVYISDSTARYRVLLNSASHSSDINKEIHFVSDTMRCINYYAKKYGLEGVDERWYYAYVMRDIVKFKNRRIANKYAKEALRKRKLSLRLIVFYILSIIASMSKNA